MPRKCASCGRRGGEDQAAAIDVGKRLRGPHRVGRQRAARTTGAVVVRVHVVLDDVVALVVGAERTTTLLVDEGMGDGVGAQVTDVPQDVRQELLVLLLAAARLVLSLRLGEQVGRHLAGSPVVQHVAPDEALLVPALPHLQAEPREDVGIREHLHLDHLQDGVREVGDGGGELLDETTGEVVQHRHHLVDELFDGPVVDGDKLLPCLLQPDQDAGHLCERPVDFSEQQEQRLVVVLLGRVPPVVGGHSEHQQVVLERCRGQRPGGVVLAEEEQIRTHGAKCGEPFPVLHDAAAVLGFQSIGYRVDPRAGGIEGRRGRI